MNILTFDLEDWFHILDHPGTESQDSWNNFESRIERNTDRILSLLEKTNQRATWFCLGWVAEKYPSLIKKISLNHDIACHSMYHQLLFKMSQDEFKADLQKSIGLLEGISSKKITAYRAPGFSFTSSSKWILPILTESGIEYDCSIFPAKRNHGGYDQFPETKPCRILYKESTIKEFPMNYATFLGKKIIFSGGGYFRLLPYSSISSFTSRSDYVMSYFHPRDFDKDQPVLKTLSMRRKFMSYTGLKNSFNKLNRLLIDYKFSTVEEAALQTNWEETSLVNLENY